MIPQSNDRGLAARACLTAIAAFRWIFFFFLKQKTAYEIRPCDWSSDVCSSDLPRYDSEPSAIDEGLEILRAAIEDLDRKSVVEGKSVRSCVELGGRRIIKKKKKKVIQAVTTDVSGTNDEPVHIVA